MGLSLLKTSVESQMCMSTATLADNDQRQSWHVEQRKRSSHNYNSILPP